MKKLLVAGISLAITLASGAAIAAWDENEEMEYNGKSKTAIEEMKKADAKLQLFFDSAAGYAVIPTVGKGGIGIGGARGKGVLYEGGEVTAMVTMTQITVGFQLGGQAYSEIIFFKDDVALADFKRGNYELGAQASAIAVTAGASTTADYNSGVAIFTRAKGGLMYEASVGGQKFKIEPKP